MFLRTEHKKRKKYYYLIDKTIRKKKGFDCDEPGSSSNHHYPEGRIRPKPVKANISGGLCFSRYTSICNIIED